MMSKNKEEKIKFVFLTGLIKSIINSDENIPCYKPTKYKDKKYKNELNHNILISSCNGIPTNIINHVVFRVPNFIANKLIWNSNYKYTKIPDFSLMDKFKSYSNISLEFSEFIKLVKKYSESTKINNKDISKIDFIYPHNLLQFLTSEKSLTLKNSSNETIAYVFDN